MGRNRQFRGFEPGKDLAEAVSQWREAMCAPLPQPKPPTAGEVVRRMAERGRLPEAERKRIEEERQRVAKTQVEELIATMFDQSALFECVSCQTHGCVFCMHPVGTEATHVPIRQAFGMNPYLFGDKFGPVWMETVGYEERVRFRMQHRD